MIVDIESGNEGWSEYTLGKHEDREHAKLIMGDTKLGDSICKSSNYSTGQYMRMVVSFFDDIPKEKAREITKEFLGLFLYGYRKDEVHTDLVEHTDTQFLHYHVRIPKLNLLTGTQLKLYWHKSDLDRKKAIIDYLVDKHGLTHALDRKPLTPDPNRKLTAIQKQREEHCQKPFDLSTKKSRGVTEERISDLIRTMALEGNLDSLDDVKEVLTTGLQFEILKTDYDRSKGFHYITIQNSTGKLRVKGDIYSDEFYQLDTLTKANVILDNKSIHEREKPDTAELKTNLDTLQSKRKKWIENRYQSARDRALEERKKIVLQPKPPKRKVERSNEDYDRIRAEVDRQDRREREKRERTHAALQELASARTKRIREFSAKSNEELSRLISNHARELESQTQPEPTGAESNGRERIESYRSNLDNLDRTTESDYHAIEEANQGKAKARRFSQDFDSVVQILANSINNLFAGVKRELEKRTHGLARLIRRGLDTRAPDSRYTFEEMKGLSRDNFMLLSGTDRDWYAEKYLEKRKKEKKEEPIIKSALVDDIHKETLLKPKN